jgi:hypothetical protein
MGQTTSGGLSDILGFKLAETVGILDCLIRPTALDNRFTEAVGVRPTSPCDHRRARQTPRKRAAFAGAIRQ